jgi:hypothetical protein
VNIKIDELKSHGKIFKVLYVEDNDDTRSSAVTLFERFFDDIIVA